MSEIVHVMLDLETMSRAPRAAIVAIGARAFTDERVLTDVEGGRFYWPVRLASSVECGGEVESETVTWWLAQGEEARAEIATARLGLPDVLSRLGTFLESFTCAVEDLWIWGNGADFDPVVLGEAFKMTGAEVPWSYKQVRCYRTLAALRPDLHMTGNPQPHRADLDALAQAEHTVRILRVLGGLPMVTMNKQEVS